MKPTGTSVLASNRKARHDFTIIDVVEAGIALLGSEVKSLRTGQVQLADAYARVIDGEVWLEGVHIAPYQFAVGVGAHDPDRPRKLLLHSGEIRRFRERIMKERLTLVPLSLNFALHIAFGDGIALVALGTSLGERKFDLHLAVAENQREWHEGVHIAPYQFAVGVGAHDPDRPRKLLLHSAEIRRFRERIMKERLTLVPLSLILRDGKVKVELALAQGRTKGDKRNAIAERDVKREIQREISQRNRR